jgi:hypothetical protein
MTPFVSIVLTGRNDGYGGDFVKRFLATLSFNHRELQSRGIPHEFVLVEWAPPAGKPLLADLVDERCPGSTAAALHSVVVDAAYHEAMVQNPRLAYLEFPAKNVGLRRARGEYSLTTNCDVLFSRHVLDRLARRELETGIVYRAPRWDLAETIDLDRVEWHTLEDEARLVRRKQLRPPYFRGGTGDFILLDTATFHRLRGFNEVYRVARIGIDANFLVHALSSGARIVDIGGPVYHVNHEGSYLTTRQQYAGREWEAPYGDDRWHYDSVVYRNRAAWGLADAPERRVSARRVVLDFAWGAVPPLVDLAAVVLPASLPETPVLRRHASADE